MKIIGDTMQKRIPRKTNPISLDHILQIALALNPVEILFHKFKKTRTNQ